MDSINVLGTGFDSWVNQSSSGLYNSIFYVTACYIHTYISMAGVRLFFQFIKHSLDNCKLYFFRERRLNWVMRKSAYFFCNCVAFVNFGELGNS